MPKYYAKCDEGDVPLDSTRLEEAKDEARRLDTASDEVDIFETDTAEFVACVEVEG